VRGGEGRRFLPSPYGGEESHRKRELLVLRYYGFRVLS
jgi:hypothetical protein